MQTGNLELLISHRFVRDHPCHTTGSEHKYAQPHLIRFWRNFPRSRCLTCDHGDYGRRRAGTIWRMHHENHGTKGCRGCVGRRAETDTQFTAGVVAGWRSVCTNEALAIRKIRRCQRPGHRFKGKLSDAVPDRQQHKDDDGRRLAAVVRGGQIVG